jgi:indolepyruvate decarboxylase
MGRGVLAGHEVALAGTYVGPASEPAVATLVEESDALLMLGVILSDTNFGVSGRRVDLRKAMLAFDGRVTVGHHVYPNAPLDALIDLLLERAGPVARRQRAATPGLAPAPRRHAQSEAECALPAAPATAAEGAPLAPGDIAAAIDAAMRVHGKMPIAADIGDCLFAALEIGYTPLVAPGYYATMGFGVPAGIGLQAGAGVRPLVLVGDGAFQMTGWELGNCRRLGLDPIVVVFNNRGWEMLRAFVPKARFNDLDDWRFAELAVALGGEGRRVGDRAALDAALDEAMRSRGRFFLIDAVLPRGARSRALETFARAASASVAARNGVAREALATQRA